MTEQPLLPPPDEAPTSTGVPPRPPRRDLVPWLGGLGFVILAAGIFYLWQYPKLPSEAADDAAAMRSSIRTVEQRLTDIDGRLNRLEQRPTVDLAKLTARMDGLDAKLADQAQIASRLDTLSGRIESLSVRDQTGIDANKKQLDTLAGRVTTQEFNASTLATVAKRVDRMNKLQDASLAFAAGRPIGEIPGAPEALARYAHAAPPTEAQLRLHFPQAEQAALEAKQPDTAEAPFVNRAWERAQGLFTIRQGGDLVVGNSTAIVLSQAKAALDVGDLAGAVKAVGTLKGQPGQAMANWLTDAKALLDARAALADMADHV